MASRAKTVGRLVADAVAASGVRWAFTVPGESFLEVLDALPKAGVKVIATRHEGGAAFMAGSDVEKSNLVGTGRVITLGDFHRITGIADIHKLHTFDHTAVINIKAGNNTFGQHSKFQSGQESE